MALPLLYVYLSNTFTAVHAILTLTDPKWRARLFVGLLLQVLNAAVEL